MTENGKFVFVSYICKRDSHCHGKCYEACHFTSMKEHAKNTFDKEPWNDPKHFRRDETPNKIYYIEMEETEENEDIGEA